MLKARIKTTESKDSYDKYLTLSLGSSPSKRERKVIRSIYLSNASLPLGVAGLPLRKGKKGRLYFNVDYQMSDAKFDAEQMHLPKLSPLTAPEARVAILEDIKQDEYMAEQRAQQQHALARSLGLYKLVPKDLRPTFECRCGMRFKKKVKLNRHQRTCAVLADAAEVIDTAAIISRMLSGNVPKKADKNARKGKAPQANASKRKQVSPKANTKNTKGKKAAPTAKRKTPKRK